MIDYSTYTMGDNGEITVVAVSGKLDDVGSGFLFDCIQGMIEEGITKIVVDCRAVDYMSSMGMAILVRAHSRLKKIGGDVLLARVHGTVADVLHTTGLNKLFHLHPTVREACASFDA